jgi:hypothetical protein
VVLRHTSLSSLALAEWNVTLFPAPKILGNLIILVMHFYPRYPQKVLLILFNRYRRFIRFGLSSSSECSQTVRRTTLFCALDNRYNALILKEKAIFRRFGNALFYNDLSIL